MINLWKPFSGFGKKAPKGKREYYAVEVTDEPIEMDDVKGFALWVHLVPYDEQPIKSRKKSEESKSRRGTPLAWPVGRPCLDLLSNYHNHYCQSLERW